MNIAIIAPNAHVALVHFPLGLLLAGTMIEVLGFLWREHSFRSAGRWMILLGALSGIPAALAGVYALAELSLPNVPAMEPWKDLGSSAPIWQSEAQAHLLEDHLALSAWGTGLAVLVSIAWLGASDVWRTRLHLPLLALLVVACGMLLWGAWHAGEAVYRYGTAVEMGSMPVGSSVGASTTMGFGIERYVVPVESHMILAGATVATALASLGLSLRNAGSAVVPPQVDELTAALGPAFGPPPVTPKRKSDQLGARRLGAPVPCGRFWLLTVLLGLITALAGWWTLASAAETWSLPHLWEVVREPAEDATFPWLTRRLAHLGGGASIVVLALVLALLSRAAPRARISLVVLAILLLLVIAAQIWFGVLLTFDSMHGPVLRFN